MSGKLIYLDNGASTRVNARVMKAMLPYFREQYGNPSSPHVSGEHAQEAINRARSVLAAGIGARKWEIVFTSGGTESNNLALFGAAHSTLGKKRKKIIISALEHSSVIEPCEILRHEGFEIVEIGVNKEGLINFEALERGIDSRTLLVSVIHASNEIGVVQDIARIGALCRARGALFHTDAVQSFGKVGIDVRDMQIDILSASAHKIGGPKGIGLLYLREGITLTPLVYGGGQERGMRGGTENVAGIAGFGAALAATQKVKKQPLEKLRNYCMQGLEKMGGKINGSRVQRIYNNVNVSFAGVDAERLIVQLSHKGILCSQKSACLSKQHKENKTLHALGLSEEEIKGSLRLVLSEETSKKDIDIVLAVLRKSI